MPSPSASRACFFITVLAAFAYVAVLSWWSPLTSDAYHHALTGMEHRFSWQMVLERCVSSYMNWNPRLGEYFAFAVATAGKGLFILLNPVVQLTTAFMMFYLAAGRRVNPRSWPDVRLFLLGLLILFACTARPGVTLYWLSGAANYSWGAAVWLGFLCLYRRLAITGQTDQPALLCGWRRWACLLPLGFLAGMTNENNIPGTWILLVLLFACCRVRKRRLPLWFYGGAAAHVAGALCMLLAPGVAARMQSASPGCAVPLDGWLDRLASIPELLLKMHEYLPLVWLLGAVGAWALWRCHRRDGQALRPWRVQIGMGMAFIATAYLMALSFCAAVVPADHAMFSATLLFGIGVMALTGAWYELPRAVPRPVCPVVVFAVLCGLCLVSTLHDHWSLYRQNRQREHLILQQKTAGLQDIAVPSFVRPSPWCSFIFWVDLSASPDDYVNRGAAAYYRVRTIRVTGD